MNFFKKLFKDTTQEDKELEETKIVLPFDDLFVKNFLSKGGKFLYCEKKEEVFSNIKNIFSENKWEEIIILDKKLSTFIDDKEILILDKHNPQTPIFINCEHLIAENGDILLSSNQLKDIKVSELTEDVIVYATTSQMVRGTGEGLAGIKINYKSDLPTNISAIKNYNINKKGDNFLNYGNSNSKNLYLLLFENL